MILRKIFILLVAPTLLCLNACAGPGSALGTAGVFFGLAQYGGLYNRGTAFALTANGHNLYALSLVHTFDRKTYEVGGLVGTLGLGPDNVLYGFALGLTDSPSPALYTLALCPQGSVEHIYRLTDGETRYPNGSPIVVKGRLYATTYTGSTFGNVLEITPR